MITSTIFFLLLLVIIKSWSWYVITITDQSNLKQICTAEKCRILQLLSATLESNNSKESQTLLKKSKECLRKWLKQKEEDEEEEEEEEEETSIEKISKDLKESRSKEIEIKKFRDDIQTSPQQIPNAFNSQRSISD